MSRQIIFEHPLNEKCRTLLRLSHLFEKLDFHQPHSDEWHVRAAMSGLLDIATILARADIKSELLKEMDRYNSSLSKMTNSPGVDRDRLEHILQNLRHSSQALRNIQGQLGQALRSSEFLNSILQRSSIAGGGFDFDLPLYHYWLTQSESERSIQLDDWRNEVAPVQEAVDLLLSLIRSSAIPSQERTEKGFFQRSLSSKSALQLIRVGLPENSGLYAGITGSKHRFSVRFMDAATDLEHPKQVDHDLSFSLSICVI